VFKALSKRSDMARNKVAIITGVEARSHRIVVVIDDGGQGDFAALAAKVPHDVERGSQSELRCIVERAVCTATMEGGRMSNVHFDAV
jgi:hypothetical protein